MSLTQKAWRREAPTASFTHVFHVHGQVENEKLRKKLAKYEACSLANQDNNKPEKLQGCRLTIQEAQVRDPDRVWSRLCEVLIRTATLAIFGLGPCSSRPGLYAQEPKSKAKPKKEPKEAGTPRHAPRHPPRPRTDLFFASSLLRFACQEPPKPQGPDQVATMCPEFLLLSGKAKGKAKAKGKSASPSHEVKICL